MVFSKTSFFKNVAFLPLLLSSLQAMEVETPCLKRSRQAFEDNILEKAENDACLKKIKSDLQCYSMIIDKPFLSEDYLMNDIWSAITPSLEFRDFQSFLCVSKNTNLASKAGTGQFYQYSFEKPGEYVYDLMTRHPNLKLGICALKNHGNFNTTSLRLDYLLGCMRAEFKNRITEIAFSDGNDNAKLWEKIADLFTLMNSIEDDRLVKVVINGGPYETERQYPVFTNSSVFKNLKHLSLAVSYLDGYDKFLESFYKSIQDSTNLEYLGFGNAPCSARDKQLYFGVKFFEKFSISLSKNKTIKTINFRGCYFKMSEVPHILTIMELANSTLEELILDENLFWIDGMSQILEKNNELRKEKKKGLKTISFKDICYIGNAAPFGDMNRFWTSMIQDESLQSLTFGGAEFYSALKDPNLSSGWIIQLFSYNKSLMNLCLDSTIFKAENKTAVSAFFKDNKTLRRLDLFSCFDREASNEFFIAGLSQNTSLLTLNMDKESEAMFGPEKMELINMILRRNRDLFLDI